MWHPPVALFSSHTSYYPPPALVLFTHRWGARLPALDWDRDEKTTRQETEKESSKVSDSSKESQQRWRITDSILAQLFRKIAHNIMAGADTTKALNGHTICTIYLNQITFTALPSHWEPLWQESMEIRLDHLYELSNMSNLPLKMHHFTCAAISKTVPDRANVHLAPNKTASLGARRIRPMNSPFFKLFLQIAQHKHMKSC